MSRMIVYNGLFNSLLERCFVFELYTVIPFYAEYFTNANNADLGIYEIIERKLADGKQICVKDLVIMVTPIGMNPRFYQHIPNRITQKPNR